MAKYRAAGSFGTSKTTSPRRHFPAKASLVCA